MALTTQDPDLQVVEYMARKFATLSTLSYSWEHFFTVGWMTLDRIRSTWNPEKNPWPSYLKGRLWGEFLDDMRRLDHFSRQMRAEARALGKVLEVSLDDPINPDSNRVTTGAELIEARPTRIISLESEISGFARMPPRDQRMMNLLIGEEIPVAQIATLVGISPHYVRKISAGVREAMEQGLYNQPKHIRRQKMDDLFNVGSEIDFRIELGRKLAWVDSLSKGIKAGRYYPLDQRDGRIFNHPHYRAGEILEKIGLTEQAPKFPDSELSTILGWPGTTPHQALILEVLCSASGTKRSIHQRLLENATYLNRYRKGWSHPATQYELQKLHRGGMIERHERHRKRNHPERIWYGITDQSASQRAGGLPRYWYIRGEAALSMIEDGKLEVINPGHGYFSQWQKRGLERW